MDDLTQCLYEFLMERRMGRVWKDEEFQACHQAVAAQEELIRSRLGGEELEALLDRLAERDSMEKERLFQETLGLVRELNGILGQSHTAVAK